MRTLLVLGALASLVTLPDVPTVAVEPGTKVTKTFTNELHLELEEISVSFNGEEQDAGEIPEVTIDDAGEIIFIDEYVSVEDGRATEIVRSFESLVDESSQSAPGPPDGDVVEVVRSGSSELEGESVRFTWDADAEQYDVAFADDDNDASAELLDGLDADGDFRFLLPEEDVEEGDSWECDPVLFDKIFSPGGDVKILDEEDDVDDDREFSAQFRDNLGGELTVTLVSIEDGVATMKIECAVETAVERDDPPEGAPAEMDFLQAYAFAFEGEGELVWDMGAGHASTMELAGEVVLEVTTTQSFGGNDVESLEVLTGDFTTSATFE